MSPISNDPELTSYLRTLNRDALSINELIREGRGYELMKALQRMEVATQLSQKRLAELP